MDLDRWQEVSFPSSGPDLGNIPLWRKAENPFLGNAKGLAVAAYHRLGPQPRSGA